MRVRFWGTRGSIAKAGPDTVRYGGNTSCVELRSDSGTLVVLDCGTGAHGLGMQLAGEEREPVNGHILVTHTHWDHIQGFPFFRPLFRADDAWTVYGPRGLGPTLRETLSGQMQYTYFPVSIDQLQARVEYRDLVEGSFDVGDIKVTAQYLNHPSLTLGYRLEADGVVVVYATDHEPHSRRLAHGGKPPAGGEDERHVRFLEGADLVIHDAQYTAEEYPHKVGWGHSTIEYAVDSALHAGAGQLLLFHHDPMRTDEAVNALSVQARDRVGRRALQVDAAREAAELELVAHTARPAPTPRTPTAVAIDEPEPDLRQHRVVVAVADPVQRRLLSEAAAADALPLQIVDSAAALEASLREAEPSLLLLERTLKGVDALELSRRLRDQGLLSDELPVVVLGREAEVDRQAGHQAGVSDWLVAPCTPQYARTRIRAWVLRTACRWQPAPLPPDETERLASLHRLGILDSPREERFDRYTRIAAALFNVPIVLVSLVDRDRQWFKSHCGVANEETPRDMAFCAHTIVGNSDALVVEDTLRDNRFAENPLVTLEPRVRFYAGTTLTLADGARAGAFCLMDHRPRTLDAEQLALLQDLGRLVSRELTLAANAA